MQGDIKETPEGTWSLTPKSEVSHPLRSRRMSASPGLCLHCSGNTQVFVVLHCMATYALVRSCFTGCLQLHSCSGATLWAMHKSFSHPVCYLTHVLWTILASEAAPFSSSLPVPHGLNLLWSTQFPCRFHVVTVVTSFLGNSSGPERASSSILLWGHFRPVLLMTLPYKVLPLSLTKLCAKWYLQDSWEVRCRWENSRKGP